MCKPFMHSSKTLTRALILLYMYTMMLAIFLRVLLIYIFKFEGRAEMQSDSKCQLLYESIILTVFLSHAVVFYKFVLPLYAVYCKCKYCPLQLATAV